MRPQKNNSALPVRCINCKPTMRPIFWMWLLVATRPIRKGEAPSESIKRGMMEVSRALFVEPETAMAISRDWLLQREARESDSS